jgi:polyferredoxin
MERQRLRSTILLVSLILFPLTYYYFSPYLIVQGASEGIVAGSFFIFTLLFLASFIFGRGFCGWICPAGAEQELLCMKVREKRFKGGWRDYVKFFIFFPWIAVIFLMFVSAGGISKVLPFYQTWYGLSISGIPSAVLFVAIAGFIGGIALIAGRRGSCHMICWMSPFMILGTYIKNKLKVPSLHLRSRKEDCIHCKQCTRNCPMSLEVEQMVTDGNMNNRECILCGECEDICPKDVIKLRFGKPE